MISGSECVIGLLCFFDSALAFDMKKRIAKQTTISTMIENQPIFTPPEPSSIDNANFWRESMYPNASFDKKLYFVVQDMDVFFKGKSE